MNISVTEVEPFDILSMNKLVKGHSIPAKPEKEKIKTFRELL